MNRFEALRRALVLLPFVWWAADAQAQQGVNTDPARAQVVLPEPAKHELPSLILIGDSTVRNGRDDGQGKGQAGQWGWGNPIAAWFDPAKVNVVNRAVGGLSSRTYLTSGHWGRTLAFIKPGDVVVMQFGHNDSSPVNDTSRARGTLAGTGEETQNIDNLLTGQRETVHTYGWYLRMYVNEIRAKGAVPVICSPVPRNGVHLQDRYAAWAREVAQQTGAGYVALHEQVGAKYDAMGAEAVAALFPQGEHVHTNWAGAELNARVVAAGLKALPKFALPVEDERPVVDASRVKDEQAVNAALPTVFLVGDSTVRSGGQNGMIGWGERIAPYFDASRVNVVNAAIGGRSSRTYFTEGRWDRVAAQLKKGDLVLIQFGHNDVGRIGDPAAKNRGSAHGTGPETVEDTRPDGSKEQVHTFGWYMERFAADAKARGAAVVLLSPVPHKDRWEQERDFADYAAWDREVAARTGAQFVDLTALVSDGYRQLGAVRVATLFADARTHTNDEGARFNAERVVAGLKRLPGNPFASYFSTKAASVQ